MRESKVCIDCPSSLICNFGVGSERGHIYVCSDCGAADFVIDANKMRERFLRKTGRFMGVKLRDKQRVFRLPAECPLISIWGTVKERTPADGEELADGTRIFRPVYYVCADCFNKVYGNQKDSVDTKARMLRQLFAMYEWMHGMTKKERMP